METFPLSRQVFLGGACGRTNWRREIAIPLLQAAGVSYYDPQLGFGEWTKARQEAEMEAKARAGVLLFVVSGETRGVASIGEGAYYLATGRPLALAVMDVVEGACMDGRPVTATERDDLNRGRILLRAMAGYHRTPVFGDVESAVRYAIELALETEGALTLDALEEMLADIRFEESAFFAERTGGGFLIQLCREAADVDTGRRQFFRGRKWHVDASATRDEVVRTALKAVLAWQEHEARERFAYRGAAVFGPHLDVDALVDLAGGTHAAHQTPSPLRIHSASPKTNGS